MVNYYYKNGFHDEEQFEVNNIRDIPITAEHLSFPYNDLTIFPNISHLTNLTWIDCHGNNFTELPDWKTLTKLRWIMCAHNQLTCLPEWDNLTDLRLISCCKNRLEYLPEWKNLNKVRFIDFSNNFIKYIPSWNFPDLEEVSLSHNMLVSLPTFIKILTLREIPKNDGNPYYDAENPHHESGDYIKVAIKDKFID